MSLWWLQPGWTDTCCMSCGAKIWPDGDPDWGYCYECFSDRQQRESHSVSRCDICKKAEAVADTCGYAVCSQECSNEAIHRKAKKS